MSACTFICIQVLLTKVVQSKVYMCRYMVKTAITDFLLLSSQYSCECPAVDLQHFSIKIQIERLIILFLI